MEHELKIIMKCYDEGIDHDKDDPIFAHNVSVFLDGQQIGAIQQIKIDASVANDLPTVDISFPNFFDPRIDPSYFKTSSLAQEVKNNIEKLEKIPNVKITLVDLEW